MSVKISVKEIPPEFRVLPLRNAFMFGEVMRVKKICKRFLECFLKIQIAYLEHAIKEYEISDKPDKHGVRLDIFIQDINGTVYNIEMQTTGNIDELLKRIRYYQCAIDRHTLVKGVDYTELSNSVIILVCSFDLFKEGYPVYERFVSYSKKRNVRHSDGSQVFVLNSNFRKRDKTVDPAIIEFLKCIRTNDMNPKHYKSALMKDICERVVEVRSDDALGGKYMSYTLELMDAKREGKNEGKIEGVREGIVEAKASDITKMVMDLNYGVIQAMDFFEVPLELRSAVFERIKVLAPGIIAG